jgi:inhibitor of the pro-sigma K processing machinery
VRPLKFLLKILLKVLLGGIVIVFLNFVGEFLNFHTPLNLASAFVTGILGLPGLILIIVFNFIL